MAGESKQIYQLTNGTFNGSSLVPFEVPNTDTSTSAEKPYITRKTTGDEVSEFVAKTQEFETDLQTDDKTIIGAINELKEGGGGNANYVELTQAEYDLLTEEEKHNGKMYFITDGGSDGSIIDDETTGTETTWSSQKISDELSPKQNSTDNALTTTSKTVVGAINEVNGSKYDSSNIKYLSASDIFSNTSLIDTAQFHAMRIGRLVVIVRCICHGGSVTGDEIRYAPFKTEYIPIQSVRILWDKAGSGTLVRGFADPINGLVIKSTTTGDYNYVFPFAFMLK